MPLITKSNWANNMKYIALVLVILCSNLYAQDLDWGTPIGLDTRIQSSSDDSRISVFAFNVPQPEVSVQIHCRSAMREKTLLKENGERVMTITCKGKNAKSDIGDVVGVEFQSDDTPQDQYQPSGLAPYWWPKSQLTWNPEAK
ncbi:hypothetical protein FHW21_001700 [Paraburkholderia sp. WP4_3_2]|nr:hypothetical protein [Paraburkholderia sp. WP4_3_2]